MNKQQKKKAEKGNLSASCRVCVVDSLESQAQMTPLSTVTAVTVLLAALEGASAIGLERYHPSAGSERSGYPPSMSEYHTMQVHDRRRLPLRRPRDLRRRRRGRRALLPVPRAERGGAGAGVGAVGRGVGLRSCPR